jgi:hypothetical protein
MEPTQMLLSTMSTNTRVSFACLVVGLVCNIIAYHMDRSGKRLVCYLDFAIRVLAYVSILAACVFLICRPLD